MKVTCISTKWTLVLGMLVLASPALAKVNCPPARYAIPGNALVSGPDAPVTDEINIHLINGILVAALRSGDCPLAAAKMKAKKRFTKLTAKFAGCRTVGGKVILKAMIDPDCSTITGRVKAKAALPKSERKKTFTGTRIPTFSSPDGMSVGSGGGTYVNSEDGSTLMVPPGKYVEWDEHQIIYYK